MNPLDTIGRSLAADMDRYQALFDGALQSGNPLLDAALRHIAGRQGKRMRPMLVLLAARYAGRVTRAALHAAVALELLHTASLVHDDVVDESDMRRGGKSVNALWGNKVAVLVGDFLLSKAMDHSRRSGSMDVVERMARLGQRLTDGELQQLDLTRHEVFNEAHYFEVVDKKTGSLFETCARLGAMLGADGGGGDGKARQAVEEMAQFGAAVGRCFQLRDDLFDYDTDNRTGKPTGNDMKEGKLTLPLLHVLARGATEDDVATALAVRRQEASDDDIRRMVRLAVDGGGVDYCRRRMRSIVDEAVRGLDPGAPAEVVGMLTLYAHYVEGRDV